MLKKLLNQEINSLTKLALKFAVNPKVVSTVIPGCKNFVQTIENMATGDLRDLSYEEIETALNLQSKKFNTY